MLPQEERKVRGRIRRCRSLLRHVVTRIPLISLLPLLIVVSHQLKLPYSFLVGWVVVGTLMECVRMRRCARVSFPIFYLAIAICQAASAFMLSGVLQDPSSGSFRAVAGAAEGFLRRQQHPPVVPGNEDFVIQKDYLELLHDAKGLGEYGYAMTNITIGSFSVVIAAHDEQGYLERTLNSIISATSAHVLHEIILVDDASSPPMETVLTNPDKYSKVRFLRNSSRQGLIKSRMTGANAATGDIVVFLDCHVKPLPNWEIPILRHIGTNYKRVVVPAIPILDKDTWKENTNAVGYKMMFEWDFNFHWFEDGNDWVPVMSGGLLAIHREWWHESGEYDPGMRQWGAENIEQSIRIWCCGGEIVVARDSQIAHVFRPKFPYAINHTDIQINRVRTVETWFDEFKSNFYESSPSVKKYKASMGDISKQLAFRREHSCQPFTWYVERFRNVFESRGLIPAKTFGLASQYVVSTDHPQYSGQWCLIEAGRLEEYKKAVSNFTAEVFETPIMRSFAGALQERHKIEVEGTGKLRASGETESVVSVPCESNQSANKHLMRFRWGSDWKNRLEVVQGREDKSKDDSKTVQRCLARRDGFLKVEGCQYIRVRVTEKLKRPEVFIFVDNALANEDRCVYITPTTLSNGRWYLPRAALQSCKSELSTLTQRDIASSAEQTIVEFEPKEMLLHIVH